jgi:hypothetical protein
MHSSVNRRYIRDIYSSFKPLLSVLATDESSIIIFPGTEQLKNRGMNTISYSDLSVLNLIVLSYPCSVFITKVQTHRLTSPLGGA